MSQQSSTRSRPQRNAVLLLHVPCSATSAAKACLLIHTLPVSPKLEEQSSPNFTFVGEGHFFPGRVRHPRPSLPSSTPLEHDGTKCGSQTSFAAYDLPSSLPPSEPNRLYRGNIDERTPVHTEGYTTRTSVPVLSFGPNNESSKTYTALRHRRPADLRLQVLGLQFLLNSRHLDWIAAHLGGVRWNQIPRVAGAVWDGLKALES